MSDQQDQQSHSQEGGNQASSSQGQQGSTMTAETRLDPALEQQFRSIVEQWSSSGGFPSPYGYAGTPGGTVDWAREYFDQAEYALRSARRVSETVAIGHLLTQMRQQIVSDAAAVVFSEIRRNPQLIQLLRST